MYSNKPFVYVSLLLFSIFLLQTGIVEAKSRYIFGPGVGQSRVEGDFTRQISSHIFDIGIDLEAETWLFSFIGGSATDNRFKDMRLLAGWGNQWVKLGTGFIGMQSSIPTIEQSLGPFLRTSSQIDTYVSATTIPLYMRLTPIQTTNWSVMLDAYIGLYSIGSMRLPVYTLYPGKLGYINTKSTKTGGTYGASLSVDYRISKKYCISLTYRREAGRLDRGKAGISRDVLDLIDPVDIPQLNFNNQLLLLTLSVVTE